MQCLRTILHAESFPRFCESIYEPLLHSIVHLAQVTQTPEECKHARRVATVLPCSDKNDEFVPNGSNGIRRPGAKT
jgi:hypothetical protein